ncbi:MAG TPA: hypothetical protein VKA70_06845 [Blastocatellia bacterium]|nr:hypothetical protein [Blastocatellia bacterium]
MLARKIYLSAILITIISAFTVASTQTAARQTTSESKRSIVGAWVVNVVPAQVPGALGPVGQPHHDHPRRDAGEAHHARRMSRRAVVWQSQCC